MRQEFLLKKHLYLIAFVVFRSARLLLITLRFRDFFLESLFSASVVYCNSNQSALLVSPTSVENKMLLPPRALFIVMFYLMLIALSFAIIAKTRGSSCKRK